MDFNTFITIVSIIVTLVTIYLARKSIINLFKSIKPDESVAVFGPQASGKTTLIRYLQGKAPLRKHFRTFGAQYVGKIVFDLSGNDTYYFRSREMYDVGGEHKHQWQAIIESQNPEGIIYIVDTTEPEEEKKGLKHICNIYNDVKTHKLADNVKLRCLLILLNKCDLWGQNDESRVQKITQYRYLFDDTLEKFYTDFGDDFRIIFGCSSFTCSEYFQMNNNYLRDFAIVLANKE